VVGAGGTGSNPDIGRAYLYDLSTSNGSLPSITFVNPESSPYDRFGSSVAISGSIVLVATSRSLNPRDGGQVYIYDLAGAMPSMPVATLNHPNPFVGDSFGASAVVGSLIAMDADYVIVGAPLRDTIAADRGAAYVFGLSPVLNIVSGAPGFTTLSWAPATSSGFLLQHASSAAPTNWLTAPSGPTNPISIPTTNRAQFYRLIRQE
jgi:hypothetical protein